MTSSLTVMLSYGSRSKQTSQSAFEGHLGAWIQATAYGSCIYSSGENVSRRRALQTAVLTSISALVPALTEAPASTGESLNCIPIQVLSLWTASECNPAETMNCTPIFLSSHVWSIC